MTCHPLDILLVEDEVIIRMDLAFSLSDMGHRVVEAGNVAEALEVFENAERMDVLITDIDMPGPLKGLALAAEVRRRSEHCRIIVMSGRPVPDASALPVGGVFVEKPLEVDDLARAMA